MAHRIKRGGFTSRSTPGSQTISGLGFKPGAVIIFQKGVNSSAIVHSVGFSDGTNDAGFATVATVNDAVRVGRPNRVINRANTAGSYTSAAEISSMNADGFTLNFTTATIGYEWDYLAFEDDIQSRVIVDSTTGTGTKLLNFGFQPSAVFAIPVPSDLTYSIVYGFGMADSYGAQSSTTFRWGTNGTWGGKHSRLSRINEVDGAALVDVELLGYTSNGANVNVRNNVSEWSQAYLAVGPELQTTLQSFTTDGKSSVHTGFKPSAVVAQRAQPSGVNNGGSWNIGLGWSDDSLSQYANASYGVNSRTDNFPQTFLRMNASGRENHGTITAYTDTGYNVSFSGLNTGYDALAIGLSQIELSPSSTSSSVSSPEVLLSENIDILVSSVNHDTGSSNISVTPELEVDETLHELASPSLTLAQVNKLSPASLSINHKVDGLSLFQEHKLQTQDSPLALSSTEINIVQQFGLSIDSTYHSVTSPELNLSSAGNLGISNAIHSVASANLSLQQANSLTVGNSSLALTSSVINAIENSQLATSNSTIGHLAKSIALVQNHILSTASSKHSHVVSSIILEQIHTLAVSKALHGLSSTELAIIQYTLLNTPHSASHAVTSPNLWLAQDSILIASPSTVYIASPEVSVINWDKLNVNFGNYAPKTHGDGSLNATGIDDGNLVPKGHGDGELQVVFTTDGYLTPREKPDGKY